MRGTGKGLKKAKDTIEGGDGFVINIQVFRSDPLCLFDAHPCPLNGPPLNGGRSPTSYRKSLRGRDVPGL